MQINEEALPRSGQPSPGHTVSPPQQPSPTSDPDKVNPDMQVSDDEKEPSAQQPSPGQQPSPSDDEVMEIVEEDPLGAPDSGPEGHPDETLLSDTEDEEEASRPLQNSGSPVTNTNVNSEMDNSNDSDVEEVLDNPDSPPTVDLNATSELDNSGDSDIEEVCDNTGSPILNLNAQSELDNSADSDVEEVMDNGRSPVLNLNANSELDNSVDSSIEEVMDHSGGDSCEEVLDDDDEDDLGAIVVNDGKSLAQLAASATAGSNNVNSTIININTPPSGKKESSKEPTLVIIDTNSILSGKGPIPIQKPTVTSTMSNNALSSSSTNGKSKSDILMAPGVTKGGATINIPDDAFLIEAPSFIVPYVFEQTGQKVLKSYVKEIAEEIKKEKAAANGSDPEVEEVTPPKKKSEDYFESPVGKLLINLGMSLVQEYVQVDLLKLQRRKAEKERVKSRSGVPNMQTQQSIISLKNNIEESKENNEPFRHPLHKCRNCNFKTESELVMSTHLETPHMKNNCYRCNFCKHTTKMPNEILLHMEQDHKIRPRLERAPAIHQCPHCAFEDNSKAKLTRHLVSCTKRFRMDKNLEPPLDWDTPGKLPKMPKNRLMNQQGGYNQAYGNAQSHQSQRSLLVQYPTMSSMANKYMQQGNRMQLPPLLQAPKAKPLPGLIRTNPGMLNPINKINQQNLPRGMIMRTASGQQVLTQPQIVGGQVIHQVIGNQLQMSGNSGKFLSNMALGAGGSNSSQRQSASQLVSRNSSGRSSQPSISITPLPRQSSIPAPAIASHSKPQGKASFVICEICDGYIKDLDQLRNHMQWIHKVKIHPKMIYNKPPLNCQKCQFRFFTDQGLERHLLGSHGLVTSSMQEAANKGQDNGRCPLCGKVYQWKLLAHVAKDHNVTLKPAHLSYKCTVCTATFGMYKLFESHVYSAHSMNSKRSSASSNNSSRPAASGSNNSSNLSRGGSGSQMQVTSRTVQPGASGNNPFKPLKINDEITIIPQPLANATPLRTKGSLTITPHNANNNNARRAGRANGDDGIEIIEIDEATNGRKENGEYRSSLSAQSQSLRKRTVDISVCGTDSDNSDDSYQQRAPPPAKRLRGN